MPDCMVPPVKHRGGSVMVWGCFSGCGTGNLVKINGIKKKEQYKQILQENTIPSGLNYIGHGFIFEQDNDPKHGSKLRRGYVENKKNGRSVIKHGVATSDPRSKPDRTFMGAT
jgi:hypothetical protein